MQLRLPVAISLLLCLAPGASSRSSPESVVRLRGGAKKSSGRNSVTVPSDLAEEGTPSPRRLTQEEIEAAILRHQTAPNKLLVDESASDELSVVGISRSKMKQLELVAGDTVLLKGKRRKTTLAIVARDDTISDNKIAMTKVVRSNLRLRLGDTVSISAFKEAKIAKAVSVQPFRDTIEGVSGDFFEVFVKPYFAGKAIPVKLGDVFQTRGAMRSVEFKVTSIEFSDETESEYCVIGDSTEIYADGEALERKDDSRMDDIGYDDIGGVSRQLGQIRELVELPLRHPQIFRSIGIPPPRGVLMFGPPGSGKTMIARALAAETGAYFHLLNGPEVMAKQAGESESKLRKVITSLTSTIH